MKALDYDTNVVGELLDDQIITTAAKNRKYYGRYWKVFLFLHGTLYRFVETGQMIRKVKMILTFTSFYC